MKRFLSLFLAAVLLVGLLAGCSGSKYEKAVELFKDGKYEEALPIFEELGDYEDSEEKAAYSRLQIANIEDGTWFFEAKSVNAVDVLYFTDGKAYIGQYYYDGNGKHESAATEYEYEVDAEKITIKLDSGKKKEIEYKVNGKELILGNGEYFTPQQVDDGLQGYWGKLESTYIPYIGTSKSENIYYYHEGTVEFESATLSSRHNDGTYYYTPVESGTYTIDREGLNVDASNTFQFGFVISEGKVVACRCGEILSVYDGFKGQDGYSFK